MFPLFGMMDNEEDLTFGPTAATGEHAKPVFCGYNFHVPKGPRAQALFVRLNRHTTLAYALSMQHPSTIQMKCQQRP